MQFDTTKRKVKIRDKKNKLEVKEQSAKTQLDLFALDFVN